MDVRVIAHDMRTPLNAVILSLQSADGLAMEERELKTSLDIALRNARTVAQMIDSLLQHGVSIAHDRDNSSGLGLAVCKELVEAHGGRIWIETERPGGAVFSFSIPSDLQQSESC